MYKTETGKISSQTWEEYRATRDVSLRNSILMSYLYIVKCNARKMLGMYKNSADIEDIIEQGILVLMECIDKYDPSRGVQFDTYASIRVRGSIIDYLRKQDWVPRNVRKKAKEIETAFAELHGRLGRPASDEEVAQELGMDVEELNRISGEACGFSMLSYEELIQDSLGGLEDEAPMGTPEHETQEAELKEIIARSIDMLNDKERTVISLYYYEELKLKEIASILNITESRVSQLHSKALMKLKAMVGSYLND